MDSNYIVIAYYTIGTGYAEKVINLEASLQKFKLPYEIVPIRHQGSWQANTQYKPYVIKQMLIKHFPKDIVYIDADAVVQSYPDLFEHFSGDFGAVLFDQAELLSGTLYLANNPRVMALVDRWIEGCFKNPMLWEQKVLQYILKEASDLKIKVAFLPYAYCKIFDAPRGDAPTVIEQFQASRELKKEVNPH